MFKVNRNYLFIANSQIKTIWRLTHGFLKARFFLKVFFYGKNYFLIIEPKEQKYCGENDYFLQQFFNCSITDPTIERCDPNGSFVKLKPACKCVESGEDFESYNEFYESSDSIEDQLKLRYDSWNYRLIYWNFKL